MKIKNFVIDFKKAYFLSDYKMYLNDKTRGSLQKLIMGLIMTLVFFLLIKYLTEWTIIESISVGLIILITNFTLFKVYDLLSINKKLKQFLSQAPSGKMNLIIDETFIELNKAGRKNIIFISQLDKCKVMSNTIFFIEKGNKNLPMKINKNEMTNGSFESMIEKLKSLKIIVDN